MNIPRTAYYGYPECQTIAPHSPLIVWSPPLLPLSIPRPLWVSPVVQLIMEHFRHARLSSNLGVMSHVTSCLTHTTYHIPHPSLCYQDVIESPHRDRIMACHVTVYVVSHNVCLIPWRTCCQRALPMPAPEECRRRECLRPPSP